jgi:hypothetical protein
MERITYQQRQVLVYAFECLCAIALGLFIAMQPVLDEREQERAQQQDMFALLDQAADQMDAAGRKK